MITRKKLHEVEQRLIYQLEEEEYNFTREDIIGSFSELMLEVENAKEKQ